MACCHVSERLLTIVYRNAFTNKEFPEINYQKDRSFTVIGTTLLYMVQAYKSRPKKYTLQVENTQLSTLKHRK
jgi:hypothetical protein